jgi:hypothetical protein
MVWKRMETGLVSERAVLRALIYQVQQAYDFFHELEESMLRQLENMTIRLDKVEEEGAPVIRRKKIVDMTEKDDPREVDWAEKKIEALTQRVEWVQKTTAELQNDWTTQFGERLARIEDALRDYGVPIGNREFSPPIGGQGTVSMKMSPENRAVAFGGRTTRREQADQRIRELLDKDITSIPAIETTLLQAERRVREHMAGHFSTATIDAVVAAIHGSAR